MVGVYASDPFIAYKSGIFSGCPQNSALFINHAVLLVGYNDNQGYWLIKNSWDTNWG
ncbi:MAG: C1 family peptidase [Flammeovirgaceae bacterium]